jgi:excinuclease UvrABC helicase subunit UvrB
VDIIERQYIQENRELEVVADYAKEYRKDNVADLEALQDRLRNDMLQAADNLEFERAATLRDQMLDIEKKLELVKKVKK